MWASTCAIAATWSTATWATTPYAWEPSMNSGAKPMKRAGWPALSALLLTAAAFAALAAGCSDHGPTNLYSNPLFGQTLSGANMQLWRVQEFSLSSTAGVGPDQYVMEIKNTGQG